jgi:hypothetical protein
MDAGDAMDAGAAAPLASKCAIRQRLKRKRPTTVAAAAPAAVDVEVPLTSIKSPHWRQVRWVAATSIDQIRVGLILTANYDRAGKFYLAEVLSVTRDPVAVSVRYADDDVVEHELTVSELRVYPTYPSST